jgi:hypothetical protein
MNSTENIPFPLLSFSALILVHKLLSHHSKLCHVKVTLGDNVTLQDKINKCTSLTSYKPSFFCVFDYHGQLQTIACNITRTISKFILSSIKYHRELFVLKDGGTGRIIIININNNNNNIFKFLNSWIRLGI